MSLCVSAEKRDSGQPAFKNERAQLLTQLPYLFTDYILFYVSIQEAQPVPVCAFEN